MAINVTTKTLIEGGFNTESYLLEITDDGGDNHVIDMDGFAGIEHGLSFDPTWIECIPVVYNASLRYVFNLGIVAECHNTGTPGNLEYRYGVTPVTGTRRIYLYATSPKAGQIYYIKLHLGRTHSVSD